MSFGFSIGDIILCTKIAHRIFSALTKGRKKASRDLNELKDALFGLCCALDILQRDHKAIVAKAASKPNIIAAQINQHVGYMITSCHETPEELDNATAKDREAADDSPLPAPHCHHIVRIQWKRILWDLRGDSLIKYRRKLQSHTDSINLLLSTFIWSVLCLPLSTNRFKLYNFRTATDRIEEDSKYHARKLNELLHQTSHFNKNIYQLVQFLPVPLTTVQPHGHSISRSTDQILNIYPAMTGGAQATDSDL